MAAALLALIAGLGSGLACAALGSSYLLASIAALAISAFVSFGAAVIQEIRNNAR